MGIQLSDAPMIDHTFKTDMSALLDIAIANTAALPVTIDADTPVS